jgi:hypothetical protein
LGNTKKCGWKNGIETSEDEVLADLLCNNTNNILGCNSILLKRNFIFVALFQDYV